MASWGFSRLHQYDTSTNLVGEFTGNNLSYTSRQKGKLSRLQYSSYSSTDQQQNLIKISSELITTEYADLNLSHKQVFKELSNVNRIRQHVNPLTAYYSKPVEVPDWNQVFEDPKLPLMVDIGSGSGRFILWLAKRNVGVRNYLGLEIRERLVKRAQLWGNELNLDNVYFKFANANNFFEELVSTYPGPLELVSILCPDPHFKNKHHKRRVVQKPLVDSIINSLMPGGQSDVLEVAIDMRDQFEGNAILNHADEVVTSVLSDSDGWLLKNPMGIRTEREIHAESEGAKVYRRLYHKKNTV